MRTIHYFAISGIAIILSQSLACGNASTLGAPTGAQPPQNNNASAPASGADTTGGTNTAPTEPPIPPPSVCPTSCAPEGACAGHGGVMCVRGADVDGSVICRDGFTGAPEAYQCSFFPTPPPSPN